MRSPFHYPLFAIFGTAAALPAEAVEFYDTGWVTSAERDTDVPK